MSVRKSLIAMAEDMMRMHGVPAVYRAGGAGDGVPVAIRRKPARKVTMEGRTMWQMEISALTSEIASPAMKDSVEIDGIVWTLTPLPLEPDEIQSACGGALWNLTMVRDASPTMHGGAA
ncbi:MAG: hypothetical protein KUA37_02005 [Desulfomicrobium sp.]|nr:hypothetical protein [Pseudomonadota bacterium]MBV1710765.1 hypothetical protein [Desulfomicrobium sp.]MBU4570373.1 hypothetical protein [Pseudomonadota bacterium]MBU4593294.1 hypothetical protein [Pseudomonadota bacterium]MBV1721556.1 hypothetical protein [Desulfomicrobium sp.]